MALRISAYKGTDPTSDKQLLVDALVLPIFTNGPVDRVAESRGGWGESTQQEAGGRRLRLRPTRTRRASSSAR